MRAGLAKEHGPGEKVRKLPSKCRTFHSSLLSFPLGKFVRRSFFFFEVVARNWSKKIEAEEKETTTTTTSCLAFVPNFSMPA